MSELVRTASEVFKALGDTTRLKLIRLLASNRFCVADLAKKLGVSQPAVSQHLKVLKNIGILTSKREGYFVYYSLNKERLAFYKKRIEELFMMAFVKCPNDGDCANCSRRDECIKLSEEYLSKVPD